MELGRYQGSRDKWNFASTGDSRMVRVKDGKARAGSLTVDMDPRDFVDPR
jgi:hypothetical protein